MLKSNVNLHAHLLHINVCLPGFWADAAVTWGPIRAGGQCSPPGLHSCLCCLDHRAGHPANCTHPFSVGTYRETTYGKCLCACTVTSWLDLKPFWSLSPPLLIVKHWVCWAKDIQMMCTTLYVQYMWGTVNERKRIFRANVWNYSNML